MAAQSSASCTEEVHRSHQHQHHHHHHHRTRPHHGHHQQASPVHQQLLSLANSLNPALATLLARNKQVAQQAQLLFHRLALKAQDLGSMPLTELMLISVPNDPTPEKSLDKVQRKTKGMANIFNFSIPKFKVGTLDQLVALSEILNTMDQDAESVTHKVAACLAEVKLVDKDKISEELRADGKDLMAYVTMFEWDKTRFPLNLPAKNLAEMIMKQYEKIGQEMDKRMLEYKVAKKKVQEARHDKTLNLARRSLTGVVKKQHLIESDNLMTALVVVPKTRIREWTSTYETLGPFVVPRSLEPIYSDNEDSLFGVTIFKKFEEEFKKRVNLKRFVYRAYEYEGDTAAQKQEEQMQQDRRALYKMEAPLCAWLRVNFGEAFICWMHLKVLRLFVESVLRFGLPISFTAALLEPLKKTAAGRRAILHAIDSIFVNVEDNQLARHKLTAKDMAEYPGLKDMLISDETLEYSFILFLFNIEVAERASQPVLPAVTAHEAAAAMFPRSGKNNDNNGGGGRKFRLRPPFFK